LGSESIYSLQGFDGSTVRALRQYDSLGQVLKTSRPFFVASGTPQWTTYTYDALSRVTLATMPDQFFYNLCGSPVATRALCYRSKGRLS